MTRPTPDDNAADRTTRFSLTGAGSTWREPVRKRQNRSGGYREKSVVLESALNEYRRLRREGQQVDAEDFCGRFPNYRKSLERLIDVEENLGDLETMENPFPEPGGEFLGFEILDELGVGAIARVYLASEPELGGRRVVVKVSADGTAEAATLGKLQHPNIVQVYSIKRDELSGMTAVCMPYQGSATLTDVLDLTFQTGQAPATAQAILDVANRLADLEALRDDDLATQRPDPVLRGGTFVDGVVHIGIQLAEALAYAHSCGVFHRDLKPSNVLLTPHGRPMLLDFNLSFDAERETTPRGGTLPYMAPEQIRAGLRNGSADISDMNPRCDVFSLGVILYELLTRKLPFDGPPDGLGPEAASLWQLDAYDTPPPPIQQFHPQVPSPIAEAIEHCLAVDSNQRFATLSEVADALRKHFSWTQRSKRTVHRHSLLCSALAVILLLSSAAALAFWSTRSPLHERIYHEAAAAYQRGEYSQAASLANLAIKDHPDFANAILLRGAARWHANKKRETLEDLERVIKLAPSAAAYDYAGCAAVFLSRFLDAETHFRKALEFQPQDARLHYKYAAILVRTQGILSATAREHLERAIALDPQFADPYLVRARYSADNLEAAVRDLKAASSVNSGSMLVRLEIIDQLNYLAPRASELEIEVRRQLEKAVDLGLSHNSLTGTRTFRRLRSEPWCEGLAKRALPGPQETRSFFADSIQPTVPLPFSP